MKYISLICARSGSKGLPNKNIRKLCGKPLISWSIETAKKVQKISRVIVSTDSEDIAEIALEAGAEVPFIRPSDLAKDNSPEWLVWRHAVEFLEDDGEDNFALVVLPATSPLREIKDVENCILEFEKNNPDIVITVTEAHRSPYFNMTKIDDLGFSSLVIKPPKGLTRRQDSPEVFDMTTVAFVASVPFIKTNSHIFEGKVRSIYVPIERSIDIDTEYDMNIAEYLATKNI